MQTVYLLSGERTDAVLFARMLYLSLCDRGYTVVWQKQAGERPMQDAVVIADADTVAQSRLFSLPSSCRCLFYTENAVPNGAPEALWLTRPFAMDAFFAAVCELCAQASAPALPSEATCAQDLLFVTETGAFFGETPLALTRTELALLQYLFAKRGQVCTRAELLLSVWGEGGETETNLVDVYIRYLRKKIDHVFDVRCILSVRGQGYMLR